MLKIGFIGTGNMGGALAKAVSKKIGGNKIFLADFFADKAQILADEIGASVSSNEMIAEECTHIFLGVKPQMMNDMLCGIKDIISKRDNKSVRKGLRRSSRRR